MTVERRMDKEDVVHMYNEILFSHKKEQKWAMRMNRESAIQREVKS